MVTPSYRQVQFLETTILSVLGQCYPNLEYIIMDGGSDDGSVAIIESYANQLAYWQSGRDAGQADAINQGFARATGDILCWLNSDDFFLPGTLRTIARQLAGSIDRPALVYGSCLCFRESDASARILRARSHDPQLLRETDYIYQPSSFWTKALWMRNGALDAELHFGFDWDWYIRAMAHCDFAVHEGILSAYRRHAAHKSGSGGKKRREEILRVVRRHGSTEQIRAYEYASAKSDDFEKRNQLINRLRGWRVPYASTLGGMLTPALWSLPDGVSRATFERCMGMLAST
ncbi:MAG: glycosyltransferase family 2 protein [Chthoniobacter sp.]|nr:glycosyltransferase family 2 protein [Chthoniobacter sp.]